MQKYYLGWDVGAWNCDKNSKSKDAIVIFHGDASHQYIISKRQNIATSIITSKTTLSWLHELFSLAMCPIPEEPFHVTLAIDTPLGFSTEFAALILNNVFTDEIAAHNANPYLFRHTERFLFEKGFKPLSALKDMIGSQATKGIHARSKFAPQRESTGVWSDGEYLTIIEAYPATYHSSDISEGFVNYHQDIVDAAKCADIAYNFDNNLARMYLPTSDVPASEGWIWTIKKS